MSSFEGLEIMENVELAPFTTWKIGGRARFFAFGNTQNILALKNFAQNVGVKMLVMGCGSNLLISSKNIDALIVKMQAASSPKIDFERGVVCADSGNLLAGLIRTFADNGFRGVEKLAGIPSSVGGAIFMNAGVLRPQKSQISDSFLEGDFLLKNGEIVRLANADLDFSYRSSALQKNGAVCLSAKFKLGEKESPNVLKDEIRATVLSRLAHQPKNRKNAGSVFKALKDGRPAGKLIDECNLKGLKCGGAMVCLEHANWIENFAGASSEDVLNLIAKIKEVVAKKFGVELEEEIQIFGE